MFRYSPKFKASELKDLQGRGTKQLFDEMGAKDFTQWIRKQQRLFVTDTTMRDAQQSLMATRVRTVDMEKIAPAVSVYGRNFFSLEMWGGATFDTAYRFLKEDPWERLEVLREKCPNLLLQMLLRGANAVGYKNYPDNVIREFVKQSAKAGIDVFRIFDSLNWIQGMEVALDETLNQGMIAEPCLCYTGDILDASKTKYTLSYYVRMAKELEKRGAHILGIKDMSGLLKPTAASKLVGALKQEIGIPIHLHTHDTSGNGVATVLMAAQAGVDIVDAAFNSMSGLTSQPALNSIVASLQHSDRDTGLDSDGLQKISEYWRDVRPVYKDFESELQTASAEIYKYEIPGGQYSNLQAQVESFGLGHKLKEVKDMYKAVNQMLGDIVKVTPSSKVVGDLAIFMVQNDLTPENIVEKGANIDFPDSTVSYFEGMMGQPEGGFPQDIQKVVLKGKKAITCRPGELLPPEDFEGIRKKLQEELGLEGTDREVISYAIYPKVFEDYVKSIRKEGSFRYMGSDIFFHSLAEGETCEVKLGEGRVLIVRLQEVRPVDNDGMREAIFEVNGNRRIIKIKDKTVTVNSSNSVLYADESNPLEVGANIPGNIIKVLVKEGEKVEANQPIAVIEAMKMETNILAAAAGTVERIYVSEGQQVKAGEMVAKLKQPAAVRFLVGGSDGSSRISFGWNRKLASKMLKQCDSAAKAVICFAYRCSASSHALAAAISASLQGKEEAAPREAQRQHDFSFASWGEEEAAPREAQHSMISASPHGGKKEAAARFLVGGNDGSSRISFGWNRKLASKMLKQCDSAAKAAICFAYRCNASSHALAAAISASLRGGKRKRLLTGSATA